MSRELKKKKKTYKKNKKNNNTNESVYKTDSMIQDNKLTVTERETGDGIN